MKQSTLIGRDRELGRLGDLIEGAADQGGTILVWGEAGIGKSTLLRAAAELARLGGGVVLETTGVEAEALLPYAGLHHLLRPVLGDVDRLPEAQKRALLAAFGFEDAPSPEPFLISLATLNLLVEVATAQPVIVVVDDVQWLDQPTHDTLAFVARRISRDPVVVIGAMRRGHRGPFSEAGLDELEVLGLDEESARRLLQVTAAGLEPAHRERIFREALGNPLALVELPTAWQVAAATASETDPQFVPLSARLERAFASRIADQPRPVRDAVLVAAVDFENELPEILAAATVLAGAEVTMADLDQAVEADLLRLDGMRVQFRHPLVRSGVLQAESATRRHAAHAALAEVLADEPYRRVWHRAQAIVGPDDEVADDLEASHTISLQRGSAIAAISALERSAQLSSDPAVRGRRLLLAAEHAFGLGRADMVDRLLSAASGCPLSELDHARMEWLREIFNDGIPGDATRVFELCQIAQQAARAGDVDLALNLLLGAALRGWWADTGPAAMTRVVEVTNELVGSEGDPRHIAALAVAQPIEQATVVIERLAAVVVERVGDADALRLFGMAAHAVGDQPRAAAFLDRAEHRLRAQGRIGLLPHVLGMHGAVRLDLGDWERARAASAEGRLLAEETGQPIWSTGTLVNDARARGLQGDADEAFDLATEVEHNPALRDLNDFLACAQLARGFAWASTGKFSEAFDELRRIFDPNDVAFHLRERFCGVMCLAEAATHAGRRDEARPIIDEMEHVATITPSPLLHMQLLYARALMADDAEAEVHYQSGLAEDLRAWPWVKARIELAYGTWLRRQRRVAESRPQLRSAQRTFGAIGARAWEEQAQIELRAAGERVAVRSSGAQDLLSAQEMQIARLAAEGLSNREIGERLFLSPRTISTHLYRIFPKLEITSRTQLAARLAND